MNGEGGGGGGGGEKGRIHMDPSDHDLEGNLAALLGSGWKKGRIHMDHSGHIF